MNKPLFSPCSERGAGVLLHPTMLPSDQGIGVLGGAAYGFVDFLNDSGLRYWQFLPLGPTGYGDSPYQSLSVFAGNPYLLDVRALTEYGLLDSGALEGLQKLPCDRVDFESLHRIKWPLLRAAWRAFSERGRAYLPNYGLFDDFCAAHGKAWLDAFATFVALKEHFGGLPWYAWEAPFCSWQRARNSDLLNDLADEILAQKFYQYLFFGQWKLLQAYARENDVDLIGDIPIFPALDSAEVWANPEYFQLKADGSPDAVAGVPPDYFSPEGQLWGAPLFDWDALAMDGYSWWMRRIAATLECCDVVRLDHFRGFYKYWSVPAGDTDARSGSWKPGPGLPLFRAIRERFPDSRFIAEDLGDLDDEVREFRLATGLPGMAILQFAFDCDPENLYLPHNLDSNSVVYSGTHDNDTTLGWYRNASESIRDQVRRYLRVGGDEISWDVIRAGFGSVADTAIFPIQDLLALDSSARFNVPGSPQGNWRWRATQEQMDGLNGETSFYLRELAWLYGR